MKRGIVRSPFFTFQYRRAHEGKLTIACFHRVVGADSTMRVTANPLWTVTDVQFEAYVLAFLKNYSIIKPSLIWDCLAGRLGVSHPMIITFDDGWADNFQFALPLLEKHGLSALFFVVTDTIGSRKYFWQEALFAFCQASSGNKELLREAMGDCGGKGANAQAEFSVGAAITMLHGLPGARREAILNQLDGFCLDSGTRVFLNENELKAMKKRGMEVGGHLHTHSPCANDNFEYELDESTRKLTSILGHKPRHLSWPHGKWTEKSLARAVELGYEAIYTSEKGCCEYGSDLHALKRFFLPTWRVANKGGFEASSIDIEEEILREL